MINTENKERYILAEKLIDLIRELPPKSRITPNAVGNLMVESEDGRYIGYIDSAKETAKKFDDA